MWWSGEGRRDRPALAAAAVDGGEADELTLRVHQAALEVVAADPLRPGGVPEVEVAAGEEPIHPDAVMGREVLADLSVVVGEPVRELGRRGQQEEPNVLELVRT